MRQKIRAALGFLLGALLIYSGALKVIAPAQFFTDVQNYDLLPWRPIAAVLAFYLPWLEISCGLAINFRRFRQGAAGLIAAMLVVFIGALAIAWIRGLDITCGCFGGGASGPPRYLLWIGRDLVLLAAAIYLGVFRQERS